VASASPPAAPPPPAPGAPARPTPAASPPRSGEIRDTGTVRRDSVNAERWSARGTVKVTGDVSAGHAQWEGTVTIGGKLTAGAARSQGTLEVGGPVEVTGSFGTSGSFHAGNTLHAGEADLRGDVHVAGTISVDRGLSVRGILDAPSLTAVGFALQGEARVPGDVVGGPAVSTDCSRDSELGTVRASRVRLHAKGPSLVGKVMGREVTVTVQRIEADSVDLEGVDVQFVRAPEIVLGRDAHVTEYEGTIVRRHPTSRVGFESRSPKPYGLRR
jgi:cytoskeletal protein CcmA (bactofilin family)